MLYKIKRMSPRPSNGEDFCRILDQREMVYWKTGVERFSITEDMSLHENVRKLQSTSV